MLMRTTAAALLVACSFCPSAGADDRIAVPPQADIEKVEATVKDLFKAEYAKTRPSDRLALAANLFRQARETKDDPAAVYVLLREARDLAARGGGALVAMQAADEMTAAFAIPRGEAHAAVAETLVAASNTVPQAAETGDELMSAAEAARSADEWDHALALFRAAAAMGRKARNFALAGTANARFKEVETLKSESEKLKGHLATLAGKPDDPGANLAVGRFRLLKQDWKAAAEHLVKGSDEKLKAAAQADAQAEAKPGDGDANVAAADAWYELAQTADATAKPALQVRAYQLYVRATPHATGLDKVRAEKRASELQAGAEARIDRSKMWTAIRRAVSREQFNKSRIIGGAFFDKTFQEVPPGGGILIGFHYTTISAGRFPGFVQPIFLTPRGEVPGNAYGMPEKGVKTMTVKAKPGYAVGAIYTRGGGGFDAFKPIFMRITDAGLDPDDKYEGPHIGGKGGNEDTLGGDGNFIIGLHGKVNDKGKMEAMSPVSVTTKGKP